MKPGSLMPSSPFRLGAGPVVPAPVVVPDQGPVAKTIATALITGGLRAYRAIRAASLATAESFVDLMKRPGPSWRTRCALTAVIGHWSLIGGLQPSRDDGY